MKTIYLYVKTHNKTGLKYLGKTTKDPYNYLGSGIDWKKHLKEFGNDHSTIILRECNSNQELSSWGRYYSKLFNVVNSQNWANRIPETGGGFCGPEASEKISIKLKGRKKPTRSEEHKRHLSESSKGAKKPRSAEHQRAWTESSKNNWANNNDRRETTAAVGRANKGRKHTPEALEKKRQAMLLYWQQKRDQVV